MTVNEIFSTIRDWAVGKFQPKGDYAVSSDIPTKISELENDEGFLSDVPDNYVTDTGDTSNTTVRFTSGDSANPTGWADVDVVTSGEKLSSLMRKFSLFVKNVRYLWKILGTTNLDGIGDGTVTGAINALNTGITKIGATAVGKTVTTTVPIDAATVIATITLSPGKWIMTADVWMPEVLAVRLEFRNIAGVAGQLNHPQIVGIINTKVQSVVEVVCTQWTQNNLTVESPYVVAIRIA